MTHAVAAAPAAVEGQADGFYPAIRRTERT